MQPRGASGPHCALTRHLAVLEEGGMRAAVPGYSGLRHVLFMSQVEETHFRLPVSNFAGGGSCFENKASAQPGVLALWKFNLSSFLTGFSLP